MKKSQKPLNEGDVVDFQSYKLKAQNKFFKKVLLSKDKQTVILAKDFIIVELSSEEQEDAIAIGDIKKAFELGTKFFEIKNGQEIKPLKESIGDNSKQNLLNDAAQYPEDFDVKHFKQLSSYKARIAYAKEKLGTRLGIGSSRIIFNADQNLVMKLAKNKKGLAQNRVEFLISEAVSKISKSSLVASVIDHDKDFLWIESEKAEQLTDKKFQSLVGFLFRDFAATFWNDTTNSYKIAVDPSISREIRNLEFYDDIVDIKEKFKLSSGDICRVSTWGQIKRNGKFHPVLIDYGLNDIVFDTFYRKKF